MIEWQARLSLTHIPLLWACSGENKRRKWGNQGNQVTPGGEDGLGQGFLSWEKWQDVYTMGGVIRQRGKVKNMPPVTIRGANLTNCHGKRILIRTETKGKLSRSSRGSVSPGWWAQSPELCLWFCPSSLWTLDSHSASLSPRFSNDTMKGWDRTFPAHTPHYNHWRAPRRAVSSSPSLQQEPKYSSHSCAWRARPHRERIPGLLCSAGRQILGSSQDLPNILGKFSQRPGINVLSKANINFLTPKRTQNGVRSSERLTAERRRGFKGLLSWRCWGSPQEAYAGVGSNMSRKDGAEGAGGG